MEAVLAKAPEAKEIEIKEKPRTIARRQQVLDAAARCFCRYGFHTTSMAQVSAEAGMSVGHIYRYFTGKEAIIAAIVRGDLDKKVCEAEEFPNSVENLRASLVERTDEIVQKASDPEKAALWLEIRAEAARNPAIGALIREADAFIAGRLREVITSAVERKLEPADLEARVEMFMLIFQGIGIRTVSNPDIDRKALSQLVKLSIDAILE